jgi:CHAT domain-containing protein/tetratricopeptide (TPR) repeat protein
MATGSHPCRAEQPAPELTEEKRAKLEDEAANLTKQGIQSWQAGNFDRAFERTERALEIRQTLYPADKYPQGHPLLMASVSNLGFMHEARGDYGKALPLYELALSMGESLYPKDRYPQGHPDLARCIDNLAFLRRLQGNLDMAVPLCERALAMREALYARERFPKGNIDLVESVNNLALLHQKRGDYAKALPLFERALAICESLYPFEQYPQGHRDLAGAITNLALLHEARGNLGRALPLCERALALDEALYPRVRYPHGHPDLGISINNLAFLHQARGDYAKALPLYERALAMKVTLYPEKRYPHGHPDLARGLHNLAQLYYLRGDLGKAVERYEAALAMYDTLYPRENYPQGHPELAGTISDLALLHEARGDLGQALALCARAVAMYEALYPKDRFPLGHPDLALGIHNLAFLRLKRGDYAKALPLYERGLTMEEALYPRDRYPHGHPDLAKSVYSLASLHLDRGDYAEALPLCERALAMEEALYPKDRFPLGHPDLALSVFSLALLHEGRGDYGRSLPLYERALTLNEGFVSAVVEYSAEAEALNLLASLPLTRDSLLSLPAERVTAEAAYAHAWRGKSAIVRVLEQRHRAALTSRDPATAALYERLQDTRRRLARQLLAPADPARDTPADIATLTADKERLEREMSERLPAAANRNPGAPADLARRLPAGAASVDLLQFMRFQQDHAKPGRQGETRTPSYVAFLVTPRAGVSRVDLGPAKPIDDAVAAWRQALLAGTDSPAAAELRRLVWEPIARQLPGDTRSVYLAPDGALCRLPWAALPGKAPGTVPLEDYALAVVPNGPALLEALQPRDRRPAAGDTVLTVGGVAYDQVPQAVVAKADARGVEPPRAAERGAGVSWGVLAATGPEAERVAALAAPRKVIAVSGPEASPARVQTELPKARWAHLATHGFFADKAVRSAFQLDERMYERTTRDRATPGARSPLVLSGLVLAGANKPDLAGDGGILTAEAIVGLDLSGLDLAVLSACETGLGEVAGGEGVYGLQRAFHQAGCRDVVASLWRVNDRATAALMAVFYHKLWHENLPPIEALRQAQLTLYRHPERIIELAERGYDVSKVVKLPPDEPTKERAAPGARAPAKMWAAFVLSGPGRDSP